MKKFQLKPLFGGYVAIYWDGILLGSGRPWIKSDKEGLGFCPLLVRLWNDKDCYDWLPGESEIV
jgi:hypothetical protein